MNAANAKTAKSGFTDVAMGGERRRSTDRGMARNAAPEIPMQWWLRRSLACVLSNILKWAHRIEYNGESGKVKGGNKTPERG